MEEKKEKNYHDLSPVPTGHLSKKALIIMGILGTVIFIYAALHNGFFIAQPVQITTLPRTPCMYEEYSCTVIDYAKQEMSNVGVLYYPTIVQIYAGTEKQTLGLKILKIIIREITLN